MSYYVAGATAGFLFFRQNEVPKSTPDTEMPGNEYSCSYFAQYGRMFLVVVPVTPFIKA